MKETIVEYVKRNEQELFQLLLSMVLILLVFSDLMLEMKPMKIVIWIFWVLAEINLN